MKVFHAKCFPYRIMQSKYRQYLPDDQVEITDSTHSLLQ